MPPGTYSGTIHTNDALAISAQLDAESVVGLLPINQILSGQDLGGLTLTPGVYQFATSAQLTGTLTLDGQGLVNPLFVFQIGSTLTMANFSIIDTINGADSDNVYFQVGSSATLGMDSVFQGDLISFTSNTLTTGASVDGHVIALNGAVTLDSNLVAVPEPGSLILIGGYSLILRRKRR